MRTTKKHTEYWENRKIDWKTSYFDTWTHPHRTLIISVLKGFPWHSLWEIGAGAGANLRRIIHDIPDKQLGGSDINAEAVKFMNETFQGGMFQVESGENILMSDRSVDVVLSDMVLIYVGPTKIKKYLKEMKRVARSKIVLCEFHSESLFKRLWVWFKSGYYVHNYKKLLRKLGYYEVYVQHIPREYWDVDNNSEFRSIIIASV